MSLAGMPFPPASLIVRPSGGGRGDEGKQACEEIIERIAALDIGEAEVMCCVRIRDEAGRVGGCWRLRPGRR
jgi:hypothetical protein